MSTRPQRVAARFRSSAEAGGFLFFSAITPHDPRTGRLLQTIEEDDEVARSCLAGLMFFDVPERPAIAQAIGVYRRLADLLSEKRLTLRDLVRQRIFIRDVRTVPVIERVMDACFGEDFPATSIVVMPGEGLDPRLHLQLEAIANAQPREIVVHGKRQEYGRYPAAVASGGLVFTSEIAGVTGEDVARFDTTSDRRRFRTERETRIYEQTLRTFANLEATIALAGATIADVVKVNGWVDFPMREYGAAVLARRQFFANSKRTMMASTGLAIGGQARPGALVSFDAVAALGGKDVTGVASPIASPYVAGAVRAGPLVFTSGEIPVRVPEGEVMATCAQLPDEGRLLRSGAIDVEHGMESRAWYVYRTLEAHLAQVNADLRQVVQQTVFIKDMSQCAAWERIATLFLGATLPPTTIVPIADTTPFFEAELEIEVIAGNA